MSVVVIGGMNLDIKVKGGSRADQATSNAGAINLTAGGVARNISCSLARLGVACKLVSVMGSDWAAQAVLSETMAAGVDVSLVKHVAQVGGYYLAFHNNAGELVTAINDMKLMADLDQAWVVLQKPHLDQATFIIADCNLCEEPLQWLIENYAAKLVVEPVSVGKALQLAAGMNWVRPGDGIFLITPNQQELEALTGLQHIEDACHMLHESAIHNIVVNCGQDGVYVSTQQKSARIAAQKITDIADVTGAGDAALAGIIYGLLKGVNLFQAASYGQITASLALTTQNSAPEKLSALWLEEQILRNENKCYR